MLGSHRDDDKHWGMDQLPDAGILRTDQAMCANLYRCLVAPPLWHLNVCVLSPQGGSALMFHMPAEAALASTW